MRANVASYSGGGRSAGLRTQKVVVVDNWRQSFLLVQDHPRVREAIQAALNEMVRSKDFDASRTFVGCHVETREIAA